MSPSPDTATPSRTTRLHGVFLERAASPEEGAGGTALGAFLTLRLVDQFAGDHGQVVPEALVYQMQATVDYLQNLQPRSVESEHLLEIARVARDASDRSDPRLLFPPMLAYASRLEQGLRMDEAMDVLETALALSDGRDAEEEVTAIYQQGRLLRKKSRYDESIEAYETCGRMAERIADHHMALVSRIGIAIVHQKVGDLPASVRLLGEIIVDAVAHADQDAEARARHDLANAHMLRQEPAAAVLEAFRAFERYEHPQQRLRALSDLGMAFKMLGTYSAAEDAFHIVMEDARSSEEIRVNAMLELLHVAALAHDRVSFERWRRELAAREAHMIPDARIDFALKLGIGFGVFGSRVRAEQLLRSAIELAETHHVNTYLFQAEEALRALTESECPEQPAPPFGKSPSEGAEAQRVAGHLRALRTAAV